MIADNSVVELSMTTKLKLSDRAHIAEIIDHELSNWANLAPEEETMR